MSDCPNDAHAHVHDTVLCPYLFMPAVIDHPRNLVVYTTDADTAHRIAELINRHGLIDVPDNAAALDTPSWSPPVGRPRELAHIWRLPEDPTATKD